MMRRLLFLILLFFPLFASAQSLRLYTTQQGLRTADFRSAYIDSHNVVWICGKNLVASFDGEHFIYPRTTDKETGRHLFDVCYSIRQISEQEYFFVTNSGLYIFNAKTNDYEHLVMPSEERLHSGVSVNSVSDIKASGMIYVTTDGFGAYVYDVKNRKVNEELTKKIDDLTDHMFIVYSFIDSRNWLWVSSLDNRIVCVDLNKGRKVNIDVDEVSRSLLKMSSVITIHEHDGNIYIGTSNALYLYDHKQNTLRRITDINSPIKSIIQHAKNELLIGTDGNGIWNLDTKTNTCTHMNVPSGRLNILHAKVADMVEDKHGNLIVEIQQKGMLVIPTQHKMFRYHPIIAQGDISNSSCITAMTLDHDENYWIATDGSGLFRTEGLHMSSAKEHNEGLNSKLVQAVIIDKRNTPWCGSYGGGVQMWQGDRWTLGEGGWLSSISRELVMDLCYDEKRDLIYVGLNGHGIYCIDPVAHTVTDCNVQSPFNPWVSSIYIDSRGDLWAYTAGGIATFNFKTKHVETIKVDGEDVFSVANFAELGDDILMATQKGLLFYNRKTRKQTVIGTDEGLISNIISNIEIQHGDIWIATEKGISCISGKTHSVTNFTSFAGYYAGEFFKKSHLQNKLDNILFGGTNGIICFTPEEILHRDQTVSGLFFSELEVSNEKVNYSSDSDILDASPMYATRISLPYSQNSFTIRFAVPEMTDPERVHYDYILEGHDRDWHRNVRNAEADFTSLPFGKYVLKVRAYYEDSPDNVIERSISVRIEAPWYWSWWAILIYLSVIAAISYFLYIAWREHRTHSLEIQKAERENELREEKLNMFTSITHELKSPLMMIEAPLNELIKTEQDDEKLNLLTIMQRNCSRMLDVVKQITDLRRIEKGLFDVKLEEHDYVEYANKVFEQFKGTAMVRDIQFIVEHHEQEIPFYFDPNHFDKIITNILSNAFKFTPEGGKVIVRSGVVGTDVELRFYNSGSHLEEEDMKHLYERFYQGTAVNNPTGSGIGLNLVHELVRLHHGKIEAKNIDPNGVEFRLLFPFVNPNVVISENNKSTILIVDDDTEIIEFIRSQLAKECNVVTAFSGNQAWKQVIQVRPDVVVTDYQMADGNGVDLCQRIKSNPETDNTPVIMLTGEGDESLRLHSLNIQVDHYLEKPVDMQMLRGSIAQVLRVREKMRNKVQRLDIGSTISDEVIVSADDRLYEKINKSIKAHLDDSEFTVVALSEEVGISKVHLTRKMKERYGMTPNVYIKSFRLKQAAYLLVHSKLNVSEVMYRVGFSNHSYFTSAFREYFSMSPTQFITFYSEPDHTEALSKLLEM